jgi:hypothetical protein
MSIAEARQSFEEIAKQSAVVEARLELVRRSFPTSLFREWESESEVQSLYTNAELLPESGLWIFQYGHPMKRHLYLRLTPQNKDERYAHRLDFDEGKSPKLSIPTKSLFKGFLIHHEEKEPTLLDFEYFSRFIRESRRIS